MKKSIIAIILYLLVVNVFFPAIFYLFNGFSPVYSDLVDLPALIKSFILIVSSFALSIFVLYLWPSKNEEISPNINGRPVSELFYFSIFLKLFVFYYYGGFSALIAGGTNGTVGNYISLFFNPFILLLILLFAQKNRSSIIMAVFFYILSVTLSGSRSGILTIIFVFLIGFSFVTFQGYKKRLYGFLKYSLLITPLIFVYATSLRGYTQNINMSVILNQIIGRMSVLETSMLPVHYFDNGMNLDLFYNKFSIWNQFKLSLDSIIPGQIFDFDVMPNNYYRAIFMGYSQSFVMENYMSVNLTLPIYLYLKYSYFAVIFTVIYIVGTYKIIVFFKKYPIIVLLILSVFYNLIYFFDWVMVFTQLYKSILTIAFLKMYIFSRKIFIESVRKNEYAN